MSAPASPLTERTQAILLRQRATSAASDVQGFGRLILAGRAALQCDGSIVGVGSKLGPAGRVPAMFPIMIGAPPAVAMPTDRRRPTQPSRTASTSSNVTHLRFAVPGVDGPVERGVRRSSRSRRRFSYAVQEVRREGFGVRLDLAPIAPSTKSVSRAGNESRAPRGALRSPESGCSPRRA